jgi:hypothetical protein
VNKIYFPNPIDADFLELILRAINEEFSATDDTVTITPTPQGIYVTAQYRGEK